MLVELHEPKVIYVFSTGLHFLGMTHRIGCKFPSRAREVFDLANKYATGKQTVLGEQRFGKAKSGTTKNPPKAKILPGLMLRIAPRKREGPDVEQLIVVVERVPVIIPKCRELL